MTPAPTMQTRSTLLREYLSAVTCQSTATALRPGRHAPKLGVGDEPPSQHGLLVVNHEYTNEELMFPALKERQDTTGFKDMTEELVDIEMAAHGVAVEGLELPEGLLDLRASA